jgi:hypothetical protein
MEQPREDDDGNPSRCPSMRPPPPIFPIPTCYPSPRRRPNLTFWLRTTLTGVPSWGRPVGTTLGNSTSAPVVCPLLSFSRLQSAPAFGFIPRVSQHIRILPVFPIYIAVHSKQKNIPVKHLWYLVIRYWIKLHNPLASSHM